MGKFEPGVLPASERDGSIMVQITILVENTAAGQALLAEHGLSFWIKYGEHRLLFDTGQGYVLKNNADRLAIPLEAAEAIVLSHGHYDHTGGLADAIEAQTSPALFLHPAALTPRFARRSDGAIREIGMPEHCVSIFQKKARPVWTEIPTSIFEGVSVTGPVPRKTEYEDAGGAFFRDSACRQPDTFLDDQALYMETSKGTIVVLGCAHAGVINTLNYVQKITDNRPIHAVIGGMHLVAASPERIENTVAELRKIGFQYLMPLHCTGFSAMARLHHEFPEQYRSCPVGTTVEFGL